MFKYLEVARDDAVEYVRLNRPDVRNALNEGLIAELTWWADDVATRRDVRVAVLAGAGPVFCAGADLEWMARSVDQSHDQNVAEANDLARMLVSLDRLPVPLVGRVHGAALGGGAGLAATCDVVVAAATTRFGFPEVKLGLIPAVIAPFVVAKIGRSAARELFLTGAPFDAARAAAIGLVHRVAPDAELDVAVRAVTGDLLTAAPGAIAAAKALLYDIARRPSHDAGAATSEAIAARRVSAEGQEGLRAFLEKRRPAWTRPREG